MARFLVRRLALGLLVMFFITVFVFWIFFSFHSSGPESVARRLAGKQATPEMVAQIKHNLGLDGSLPAQYWHFIWGTKEQHGLLRGSLGFDYYTQVPVTTEIKQAFPITLSLALGASVLWLAWGVLTGVLSAIRSRSLMDRFFTTMALFFYSFPTFVLGLMLLLVLFYQLTKHGVAIFPASGYVGLTENPWEWAHHLILPWITLAAVTAASYTRLTRGSMLDVLGEDYIRTARAKGLPERRVIFRHALRAGITPVVTQFGIDLGVLIGGAIITETVFGLPGLGWNAIRAIPANNLPLIIGITIIASGAIVVANILVDVLYAVLDPRVRLN